MAGITFAIIGSWIAILNPEDLVHVFKKVDKPPVESADRHRRFKKLLLSLRYSAAVVILVLATGLFSLLAKQIPIFISHISIMRGVSFSILVGITFLEIWAFMLSILAIEMADLQADREKNYNRRRRSSRGERK